MALWFSPAAPRVRDDEQVVAATPAPLPANLCLAQCPAPWGAPTAKNPGRPGPSPQAPATKHLAPNQLRAAMWAVTPAPNDGATGTLPPATGVSAVATAGKLVMQEPRPRYVRQSTWSRETPGGWWEEDCSPKSSGLVLRKTGPELEGEVTTGCAFSRPSHPSVKVTPEFCSGFT